MNQLSMSVTCLFRNKIRIHYRDSFQSIQFQYRFVFFDNNNIFSKIYVDHTKTMIEEAVAAISMFEALLANNLVYIFV